MMNDQRILSIRTALLVGLAVWLALPATAPLGLTSAAAAAQEDGQTKQERKEEKRRRKAEKKRAKQARKAEKAAAKAQGRRAGRYGGRTPQDLVAEARRTLEDGKELKAREILLFLEDNERAREVQDEVKLLLAHSYYQDKGTLNWVEALSRYRTFLTFFPHHPEADLAQYRIGMAYLKQTPKPNRDQSTTENALFEFQKVIELYPNSPYAEKAQERIREARDLLAEHELRIGRFYYEWEEWEAAAGRFERILASYPDYEKKDEVYRLLAEARYKLGDRVQGDVYADKYREAGGDREIHAKAASRERMRGEEETKKERKAREKREKKRRKAEKKREKQERKAREKERKEGGS